MLVIPELVDGCRLRCPLCINSYQKLSMRQMNLETVQSVLDKYPKEKIEWFNWGEPLLHDDFIKISEMIKGTNSRISTTLSLKLSDEKINSMKNFRSIIVSLSGMTKDIYNIYHKGGRFDLVMENIQRSINANINLIIRWQQHVDNTHQYAEAEKFCKDNGIKFNPIKLHNTVERDLNGFEHKLLSEKNTGTKCKIMKWAPIDVDGNYLLCCATENVKIGYNIKDNVTQEELIEAKMKTDTCTNCRAKGLWKS